MNIIYLFISLWAAAIPEEPKFSGEAEKVRLHFVNLFEASKKVNASQGNTSARGQIENALDWDRISIDCLGKTNWAKSSGKTRSEFTGLLKEVITRTSYTRLDKFWEGATARFEKIEIKGSQAHVMARFYVAVESFSLEYYLSKKQGRWFIYDLAYEGLRYSANINEQIEAFLREKPMGELLGKLRKRRDELRS